MKKKVKKVKNLFERIEPEKLLKNQGEKGEENNVEDEEEFSYPEAEDEEEFSYPEAEDEEEFSYPEADEAEEFSWPETVNEEEFSWSETAEAGDEEALSWPETVDEEKMEMLEMKHVFERLSEEAGQEVTSCENVQPEGDDAKETEMPEKKFLFERVDKEEIPAQHPWLETVEMDENQTSEPEYLFDRVLDEVQMPGQPKDTEKDLKAISQELIAKSANQNTHNSAIAVTQTDSIASSNFALRLKAIENHVEELKNDKRTKKLYTFEILMQHLSCEWKVKCDELEDFRWVQKATDGRAYFSEREDRREFALYVHTIIERDIDSVENKVLYRTSGWKEFSNGNLYYVCDVGVIGFDAGQIRADTDLKFQIDSKLTPNESFDGFWGMQKICKRRHLSRYLMMLVCKSVMTTLFDKAGFPDKNVTAVLGTTNTLKTSTALVFSKIFDAEETNSPELTFSSTQDGIETYVAKYSDAILLVDDFMPGGDRSKQAELNGKLELLCRLYGDRASKKRMSVYAGKDVEFPVRGCCMITAEHLTGVQSSRTRMTCINFESGDVDKNELYYYQTNPLILPTYLYNFIAYLSTDARKAVAYIQKSVPEYRKMMRFKTARYNETAAQFMVTLDIMFQYWQDEGFLNDIVEIQKRWKSDILEILHQNDAALEQRDLSVVIIQALVEEIRNNPSRVKHVDEIRPGDAKNIYFDDDHIFIQLNELYLIVKDYCKRFDIHFYLQPSMVSAKLKEKELLETVENSNGHVECARKLKQSKGVTQRFLYIKREKVDDIQNRECE